MTSPKKRSLPAWAYLAVLVSALAAAGYTCVSFSIYKMPSGSMIPTILTQDRIAVKRRSAAMTRGEVIVHRFPENKAQSFVKRIIALPGDTFEVVAGRPVINGKVAPRCYVGSYPFDGRSAELYLEFLGDAAYGTIFEQRKGEKTCAATRDCPSGDECVAGICGVRQGPYKIQPDEVWVLGDNRDNSHDSRSWRGGLGGGVPVADILGPVRSVLFAFQPSGGLDWDRSFSGASGPPALPASLKGTLGPAIDKCLRERPSAEKIPR